MPVATRAALWLACVSPLVWIPGGFDRFVFPKLALSAAAIGFGAISERRGKLPRQIALVALLGLGWFVVACLLSPTPMASLVGRLPRYEGLPVLLTYAGSAWLGARLLGGRDGRRVKELVAALSVVSIALLGFSVLSEFGWNVEGASAQARTGSVLGNATEQGLVGMMLFAVLFAAAVARPAPLVIAGAVASPITVVLSGSRAAFAVLLLALAVQVFLKRRDLVRPALAAAAAIGMLGLAVPQLRDRLTSGQTISGRLQLWEHGLQVGLDRWWSGGPSTFVDASGRFRDDDWVRVAGTANPPDSPHNWVLQAFDSGGLPLLALALALAGLIGVLGWRAVRANDDPLTLGAFAATIAYGVGLLPNFTAAGSTCLAAFLVGCLVAEPAEKKESSGRARVVAGLGVAGVLIFVMSSVAERSLQQGVEAAAAGDLGSAESAFSKASQLRPFDGDVAMVAAQAYAGAVSGGLVAAVDGAERWAQESLARTPDTYASSLALAVAQISVGDLGTARARLDRLVLLFPTEPAARVQLGIVKFGQRDVDGAREELLEAQRMDPLDPTAGRILDEIERRLESLQD